MTVRCSTYNQIKEFKTPDEAKAFFLECMRGSEGSEQARYVQVYSQLMNGHTFCTDKEFVTDAELFEVEKYFEEKERMYK